MPQIGGHRCRSCGRGCRRRLHGRGRRVLWVSGRCPSRVQNSASFAWNAASTWAVRFENTSNSSAGCRRSRLALSRFAPGDSVAGGDLGAQHRLIDATQRPLKALQGARVEGAASGRRRFAPWMRSRHGSAAADHPTVTWSGGTPPAVSPCLSGCSRRPFDRIRVVDP